MEQNVTTDYLTTTRQPPLFQKSTSLRVTVGFFCVLSIMGSILIIFSYVCFKNRRTKAREILMHISIMDLGVGLANLIGLSVYFDQYHRYPNLFSVPHYIDNLCKMQAFFTLYFTLGSVFWTVSLMVYLYFRIIHSETKFVLYFPLFCYIFCYGTPFVICLWLVLTEKLGFSPFNTAGWCGLMNIDPLMKEKLDIFGTIFGREFWIYLASILISILYVSVRLLVNNKIKTDKGNINGEQIPSTLQTNVDYKFALIPVVFICLRIWSCIIAWLIMVKFTEWKASGQIYPNLAIAEKKWYIQVLYYLSGIGDSSQGFANALLFIAFSKNVRDNFKKSIWYKSLQTNSNGTNHLEESSKSMDPSQSNHEEATGLSEKVLQDQESSLLKSYSNYNTLS